MAENTFLLKTSAIRREKFLYSQIIPHVSENRILIFPQNPACLILKDYLIKQ